MHLYTFLQLAGLVLLWVVKSSVLALAFPFFVVAMIPFRMSLRYIFTPRELEAVSWTLQRGRGLTLALVSRHVYVQILDCCYFSSMGRTQARR